jgi:hypothetical protein
MATGGDASQFPRAKLEALLAGTGDVIDALGGNFTMPYAAMVLTATAMPSRGSGSARFSYGAD